ncbi:hypothetical protein [Kribbella sp. NPDC006257]|uniref:hypothetical protein n=1 Tax=Kribbella sp. NPDC006257 TaxID=3156738 RepID=UPI0033AF432C
MSFDRPGLPHPGHKANEVEIDEVLAEEGVELTDRELDGLDRPGTVSEGPVPNPPRRPGSTLPGGPAQGIPVEGEPAQGVPVEGEPAQDIPVEGQPAYGVPAGGVDESEQPVDDPAHDDPAHDHPAG